MYISQAKECTSNLSRADIDSFDKNFQKKGMEEKIEESSESSESSGSTSLESLNRSERDSKDGENTNEGREWTGTNADISNPYPHLNQKYWSQRYRFFSKYDEVKF